MHDQHLVINHCGQRQPAENLLEKLEDLLAMHLQDKSSLRLRSHTEDLLPSPGGYAFTHVLFRFSATSFLLSPKNGTPCDGLL